MPGTTGWLEKWYFGQIRSVTGLDDPQATAVMDQFMPQAVAHAADQGDWYDQGCSDSTSLAALNWLSANPFLVWVPKGTPPPAQTVPPKDIAQYVLKSMILPPIGPALSPTPPAPSIVNLPTQHGTSDGGVVWSVSWTSNQGVGGTLPNTVPIPGDTTTVTKEIESVNG